MAARAQRRAVAAGRAEEGRGRLLGLFVQGTGEQSLLAVELRKAGASF